MSNELMTLGGAVPAHIAAAFGVTKTDDLTHGVGMFGVFSIRGSKWRVVKGGVESLVKIPGTDDAAPSVEVVLLKANPNLSKTYYKDAYVEGSDAPPDCFSNDGMKPDAAVEEPQCETCAACPQNVWGSKITPQGSKVKACADIRRVAAAPVGMISEPLLLRVPGASLGDLAKYGSDLNGMGVHYSGVVTKLAFDADAAYPKITFKAVRFLEPDQVEQVKAALQSGVVDQIINAPTVSPQPAAKTDGTAAAAAKPAARKKAAPEAAQKPAAPEPQPASVEKPAAVEEPVISGEVLPAEQAAALDAVLAALNN